MENIRQQFLDEAVSKTENLLSKLSDKSPDENLRRYFFRALHTLKGTSQTLGFNAIGKLAHELENLLQAVSDKKIPEGEEAFLLLKEGTEILHENLQSARNGNEASFPKEFIGKIRAFLPASSAANTVFSDTVVPSEVLSRLSIDEKKSLQKALADGKNFYAMEVEFSLSDFDKKFRHLRETLSDKSEIIANFPKPDVFEPGKIGFRIYFTGFAGAEHFSKIAESSGAELTAFNPGENFTNDLQGVLKQAVFAGRKLAHQLAKNIEFKTTANISEVSAENLKLLSEILLHLVRNAVDHAIEKDGRIEIDIRLENDNLLLRVADNGFGLDEKKILAKAVEKNLIAENENLSREEIFDLIFAHGFSTADKVSEISGRGVGLDVVRDAIEKTGGKIRVASQSNQGTTFEILLPEK